jgi:predicted GNAT family acetyltransferase
MRVQLTRDAARFAEIVGPMLAARIESNIAATVLDQIVRGEHSGPPPLFAYGLDAAGEVTLAALRTPPWPLLASAIRPPDAGELVERWLAADPQLPGVSGEPALARAIAAAWAERTARPTRLRMSDALHILTEVVGPARLAAGRLRAARADERELLIAWEEAFVTEADAGVVGQAEVTVDRRMRAGMALVWDDGGPSSTLALTRPVAGTARIGAVYTPPELRDRGYASSLVAAASRLALAHGSPRCILFTDLANPVSNRIYAALGYRRVGAWEEHLFLGGATSPGPT